MANRPGPAADDQRAAIALLSDPATHRGRTPERIDTHGAMIFLAGDLAWKLKRAVAFPYMDFSSPVKRHAACRAELRLNRRTAPALYRGLVALVGDGGGCRLAADPEGETPPELASLPDAGTAPIRDWAVLLRRFPDDALLDARAAAGALDLPLMERLADAIADFHATAPPRPDSDPAALAGIVAGNLDAFRARPDLFPADRVADLAGHSGASLERLAPLIAARSRAGFVRHGHGDLHLRNIVLLDGVPTLFDALEFDADLATIDVLYDLAFLLMDLEHRGLRAQANRVLNRYLERTDDLDGLALLPLFLATRAAVRAKVAVAMAAAHGEAAEDLAEARAYFDLARRLLTPQAPSLIAIGGLSGTGKTSLARALAPTLGPAPGAVLLRSDVLRKRRAGVAETARLPPESYTPDAAAATYADLLAGCERALRAGHGVIADAVSARPAERAALSDLAQRLDVAFAGIWLEAPATVCADRVTARSGDASDADARVVAMQRAYDPGPIDWHRLDAERPLAALVEAARGRIGPS